MRSPLFGQMNGCALRRQTILPNFTCASSDFVLCVFDVVDALGLDLKLLLADPTVDVVFGTSINVDWVFDCFDQGLSPFLVSFSNPLTISGCVVLGLTAHW